MSDPIQTVREALSDHTLRSLVAVQRHAAAMNALDRVEAVVRAAREYRARTKGILDGEAYRDLARALTVLDPTEAPS